MLNFSMKSSVSFLALAFFLTTDLSAMDPRKSGRSSVSRTPVQPDELPIEDINRRALAGPEFPDAEDAALWKMIYQKLNLKNQDNAQKAFEALPEELKSKFLRPGRLSFFPVFDGSAFQSLLDSEAGREHRSVLYAALVKYARLGKEGAKKALYEVLGRVGKGASLADSLLSSAIKEDELWAYELKHSRDDATNEDHRLYYMLLVKGDPKNEKIEKAVKKLNTYYGYNPVDFVTNSEELSGERVATLSRHWAKKKYVTPLRELAQRMKAVDRSLSLMPFSAAAYYGDSCSMVETAGCLETDNSLSIRPSAVLRWYLAAAKLGNSEGMFRAAKLLHKASKSCPDSEGASVLRTGALKYYFEAGELGHVGALSFATGLLSCELFEELPESAYSPQMLLEQYERTASIVSREVLFQRLSIDIPMESLAQGPNAWKILECFEVDGNFGSHSPMINAAALLEQFEALTTDPDKVIEFRNRARGWYERALPLLEGEDESIIQGKTAVMRDFAILLHRSMNATQDLTEARLLYTQALQLMRASIEFSREKIRGFDGTIRTFNLALLSDDFAEKTPDPNEASKLRAEAFETYQGISEKLPEALTAMGIILLKGFEGKPVNSSEALICFLKSSCRGNAVALINAGHMVKEAFPDFALSLWYRAAEKGYTSAMIRIALALLKGSTPDLMEGYHWLEKAATLGNKSAKVILAQLTPETTDHDDTELIQVLEDAERMPPVSREEERRRPQESDFLEIAPEQLKEICAEISKNEVAGEDLPSDVATAGASAMPRPQRIRGTEPTNPKYVRAQLRAAAEARAAAARAVEVEMHGRGGDRGLDKASQKILHNLFSISRAQNITHEDLLLLSQDPYFEGRMTVRRTTTHGTMVSMRDKRGKHASASTHRNHTEDNYTGFHWDFLNNLRQMLVDISGIIHEMTD